MKNKLKLNPTKLKEQRNELVAMANGKRVMNIERLDGLINMLDDILDYVDDKKDVCLTSKISSE